MRKLLASLLSLLAFVACTETVPKVPENGGVEYPQERAFAITLEELHATRAITQVVPENPQMYYVMYLEEVSYLKSGGINTKEELWADDLYSFESKAQVADMGLKEYMQQANILFQGSQRIQWNNVLPGIKSVLYIYGVEFAEDGQTYEHVTNVAWKVIEPESAPLQDIKFGIDVEVEGAEVTVVVEPKDFDGYYLVKVVEEGDELYPKNDKAFTEEYMDIISNEWTYLYQHNIKNGYKKEEILASVGYKGKQTLGFEKSSDTAYSVLVFAVEEYDGFVQVVSKPSYNNFKTESVQHSDMDINIEITNCYVRVADLRITPSEPDTQYLLMITPTYYLPSDYTNDELVESALGEFSHSTYTFKGEITSHLNTLYPSTEYLVVVFGYSGGVVTTDVYTKIFKTEAEGTCELEVTDVVLGGPYRPSDIYNYDPVTFSTFVAPYYYDSSQYIITIEVKTSEPTKDIFSYFISEEDYYWLGKSGVMYDLLADTCTPFTISEGLWDNGAYYLCAAAFDYKGNVTPMWRSELYSWSTADIRPVEEFIASFEANKNLKVMSLSAVR